MRYSNAKITNHALSIPDSPSDDGVYTAGKRNAT